MPTNIQTKWPGVYVEELPGLSLSVNSGATAVPVFIGAFSGAPSGLTRLNSWLDVQDQVSDSGAEGEGAGTALKPVLRGYFENGGGYCYVASTVDSSLAGTLEQVNALDDVTMLIAPGLWDQGAEAAREWAYALIAYADEHQAMAILHTDQGQTPAQARETLDDWKIDSDHAVMYYPWLIPTGGEAAVPPSGVLAGIWGRVDRERGVWRAPANVAVRGVASLEWEVSDSEQGALGNINPLRSYSDTGILVWGARTLRDTDSWRYIPVRRLFNAAERDIQRAMRFAVFEPNTPPTWERVRSAVDNYLYNLWTSGALLGNTPEEAYFVQVGKGITMTDQDIAQNKLILKFGLAAVRPAEFIIAQLTIIVGEG
ncbi:phage tail sheath family protein [Nocardia sp. NBC_01327]|uniref:phage tail sheath family protein n=1 Tax=Nocardia sp. NBC_01327 TaxID=2903593 RepID=UPI002E1674A2|nr:phage tail sheath subtilisin-like domain-containing protein [Nocardia sp. NBC_01327]